MYKIYADGELLYSPNLSDEGYAIINPTIVKDVNKAGSISFVLPPSHPFYDRMKKLKTILTVYHGDEMIFRGRVLSFETDFYKRKTVYCEGELAYLNDSVIRPYTFVGTASALFNKYIAEHNEQVGENAQFTVGNVDVQGTVDVKVTEYESTWYSIENMIEYFGGYLYIRHANGVRYIDYMAEPGETDGQTIEFGKNLLDLTEHITAEDVFTVLIPLGATKSQKQLTISSVNDGKDYIQDDAAVALFGKIWKTNEWSDVKTASKLLEKGMDYLQKGIEEAVTLTVSAIDLHLVDVDTDRIEVGKKIRVVSPPHGFDSYFICSAVTLDLVNLDRSMYTFGNPKNTATGEMVTTKATSSRAGSKADATEEEVWNMGTEVERDREHIKLLAWSTFKNGSMTQGETTHINMTPEEILYDASRIDIDDALGIVNQMKASIEQTATGIVSKVSKNGVVSAINQTAETIKISASKIELEGETIADLLSSCDIECANLTTGFMSAETITSSGSITGGYIYATDLLIGGADGISMGGHSHKVSVDERTGIVTLGEVDETGGSFKIADTKTYKDGVSAARIAGSQSVTIASDDITHDNSSVADWYDRTNKKIYMTVRAEASNANYNTNRIDVDASAAYQAGFDDGGGSRTYTEESFTYDDEPYTMPGSLTVYALGYTRTMRKQTLPAGYYIAVVNASKIPNSTNGIGTTLQNNISGSSNKYLLYNDCGTSNSYPATNYSTFGTHTIKYTASSFA